MKRSREADEEWRDCERALDRANNYTGPYQGFNKLIKTAIQRQMAGRKDIWAFAHGARDND